MREGKVRVVKSPRLLFRQRLWTLISENLESLRDAHLRKLSGDLFGWKIPKLDNEKLKADRSYRLEGLQSSPTK